MKEKLETFALFVRPYLVEVLKMLELEILLDLRVCKKLQYGLARVTAKLPALEPIRKGVKINDFDYVVIIVLLPV